MTTQVRARDLFEGLNPEEEQKQRMAEVKENPVLEEIISGFRRLYRFPIAEYDTFYEVCGVARPDSYTAKDIKNFSVLLPQFQDLKDIAGLYISNLINNCPTAEREFTVLTTPINGEINELCYMNNKRVEIIGDVNGFLGTENTGIIEVKGDVDTVGVDMKNGSIIIHGDCRDVGESMLKGNITIDGDVSGYLGGGIYNGKIIINGNFFGRIGNMSGGEIHIHGDHRPTRFLNVKFSKGKVYHQGKLIVKNGRRIK